VTTDNFNKYSDLNGLSINNAPFLSIYDGNERKALMTVNISQLRATIPKWDGYSYFLNFSIELYIKYCS